MVLVMAERQAPLDEQGIAEKVRGHPEGFTVHPYTGRSPTSGYQVAVQGRTEFHPASILDDTQALSDKVFEHRERNGDLYRKGGRHYIGGWRAPHPKTGADSLWLEPSERVKTRHRAVSLGVERNQIEVWDNARKNSIATGGTGFEKESSSTVPRQLGRTDRRAEASGELRDGPDHPEGASRGPAQEVTHAGLALLARDTGRVLCLQRALSDDDPAGGKWEMPGGSLEQGESPIEGAIREWKEETGCELPPGEIADSWLSNGMYRGFVYVVPGEDVLDINGSPEDRQVLNPDGDPDGDNPEVVAWWLVKDLKKNQAVRKEFREGTDWSIFSKALRRSASMPISRSEVPLSVIGSAASSASTPTLVDDGVLGSELVPVVATGFVGVDNGGTGSVHDVLASGSKLPMSGVHTSPVRAGIATFTPERSVVAGVVNDKIVGDRAEQQNIDHSVSFGSASFPTHLAIPQTQSTGPRPTIIRPAHIDFRLDPYGKIIELHESVPYHRAAAEKPPCECGHPQFEHSRGRGTCDSCWRNFIRHFQDWYKGTGPPVTYCKRYKGDRSSPKEGSMKVSLRKGAAEEPELPSEALDRIFAEAEEETKRQQVPGLDRHPSEISYEGGGKVPWDKKYDLQNPDMTKKIRLVGEPPIHRMNQRRQASDEIVVPRNIDTLRDSECAVCGSVGTMNGDRCTVCGYMATPQAFQSPDLSLAPKVRDELGIGNPEGDDALGAPDSGLEGPPGAENDLDAMGEPGQDQEGLEGDEDVGDLICDNCGATFDSEEQEEDLSEPYLSPAARIEPDVSALGVQDDMEVAREVAQEENEAGSNEGVARQEGDECPVCGVGTLVPNDEPEMGEEDEEGMPGQEPGPDELDGEAVGGVPEDEEELPPGEEVPPGEEEAAGEEEGPDGGTQAPPQAEDQEEEEVPDEGEPVEEEPDEDDQEDEQDGPPFGRRQRKESSTMADLSGVRPPVPRGRQANPPRRQATAAAPNPAALERRRLFQALEATTASLNRQADLLQEQDRKLNSVGKFIRQASTKISELSLRNETLERQMALVANASGLMEPLATIGAAGQNRVAALYGRTANPANPAQPVPEPGSEPPVVTSQEAMQSAGRDDVTQLGASPVSDVAADGVTSVDVPYGEIANEPVGMNRTDVTAPVQGTETATPPEMTVIPVDTRIGNPDDPQVAFPFTVGPVGAPGRPYSGPSVGNPPSTAAQRPRGEPGVAVHPQAQAHYIASVNLARLRAQVGISNEEPFQLGAKIAESMSDAQINAEAQGLQAVASRQARQTPPPPFQPGPAFAPVAATDGRPMVPHMASTSGSSVLPTDPSFQAGKYGPGPGAAIQATTMFAPRPEEMGWDAPV